MEQVMQKQFECDGIIFGTFEKALEHYEYRKARDGVILGITEVKQ
jgi:hypothetical protein